MSHSLQKLPTTISAVINATGPISALILSFFLVKKKMIKQEVLGVLIGLVGISIAFSTNTFDQKDFDLLSAMFLFFAVSLYALSAILTGKFLSHESIFTLAFYSLFAGTLFSGFIVFYMDEFNFSALNSNENLLYLAALGIFNSGIGNVLYYKLLQLGGPLYALLITYLMPITTIFLGVWLLGETLTGVTVLALVFVFISIFVIGRKARSGGVKV